MKASTDAVSFRKIPEGLAFWKIYSVEKKQHGRRILHVCSGGPIDVRKGELKRSRVFAFEHVLLVQNAHRTQSLPDLTQTGFPSRHPRSGRCGVVFIGRRSVVLFAPPPPNVSDIRRPLTWTLGVSGPPCSISAWMLALPGHPR